MKRTLALAAAGTLMAGVLSACGGDGGSASATDTYCDSMKSAKESFADFDSGDMAGLESAIKTFHELAAEAPDDIADAWKTLDGAMVTLEDGLAEAGIEVSDLEAISNGELPEGLDMAKLTALGEDLEKMGAEEVEKAAEDIEKHAKDECNVDLSE
jgi:hypothetical protein